MDWGHRNPGDGRIVGDVVPLSTSDDMGVEMAMENPFLAASQAEMPAQRQQSRSFIRDIVTSLEDPNIASTASEGTTVGERAGSKSMSGGLAPSDAEVQDVQGKSEDGSQEKHEKCLATLNGKDSSSLLKASRNSLHDDVTEEHTRMQPILMPGQDGVGGLAVKASNIKSMGLVLEGANGNEVPVPYKVFAKADVLQEIRNLGKDSDWAEHKSVLRVCPLDELLVVHDPHKLYGHSFAWVFTEVAYDVMAKRLQECREAAVTMYVRDRADEARKKDKRQIQAPDDQFGNYVPPRTWSSTTIDITNEEIRRMELQPKRSLLTRIISKKYRLFKEPCHFQATSDKIHSSRPQKVCPVMFVHC
ncbi:hypothetical protein TGME49_223258 [Toxoplasma gondii ME49]|uniref:Uncharacterized protein n=2 Tax=Toxoplasma gondii TaxID=5811 RepID=A0A086KN86_TOXGO|nr:hypothetical protein TGME49_223258 [Toxoplasma gondii ME49]EPT26847.1 hypothetical protein TGME49_223258 [Toxoplasma gondii ME49]KFG45854.1 hypothetical protein TGDOM2_223258 [Toxoplasma gondii GAB2-2007-GAL-DOM2]|eukprot:XP_018635888.1 hypothetical protein TGME49_223258 [Toxoplasma gondii ME49]